MDKYDDVFNQVFGSLPTVNSKDKGNNNEREACKFMERWTGQSFCRVPNSGGIHNSSPWFAGDIVPESLGFLVEFNTVVETKHWKSFGKFGGKGFVNTLSKFWDQNFRDVMRMRREEKLFKDCRGMLLLRENFMTVGHYWLVVEENKYNIKFPCRFRLKLSGIDTVLFNSEKIINYPYEKII